MTDQNNASEALESFATGSGIEAADELAKAFEIAGNRISQSLEKAALSGEFSFNNLAESITRDLARLAISELVTAPLQGLVSNLGGQLFGSAIGNKPPVTVNMNISGATSASGFQQSQGQIATRLAKAVAQGQGRI